MFWSCYLWTALYGYIICEIMHVTVKELMKWKDKSWIWIINTYQLQNLCFTLKFAWSCSLTLAFQRICINLSKSLFLTIRCWWIPWVELSWQMMEMQFFVRYEPHHSRLSAFFKYDLVQYVGIIISMIFSWQMSQLYFFSFWLFFKLNWFSPSSSSIHW